MQLVDVPEDDQWARLRAIENTMRRAVGADQFLLVDRQGRVTYRVKEDEAGSITDLVVASVSEGHLKYEQEAVEREQECMRLEDLVSPYRERLTAMVLATGEHAFEGIRATVESAHPGEALENPSDLIVLTAATYSRDSSGVLWWNALRRTLEDHQAGGGYEVAVRVGAVTPDALALLVKEALDLFASWLASISDNQTDVAQELRDIKHLVQSRIVKPTC